MGLRALRIARGLTVSELARLSGVHAVKIYQIEAGRINIKNISLQNGQRLALALACTVQELLDSEGDN